MNIAKTELIPTFKQMLPVADDTLKEHIINVLQSRLRFEAPVGDAERRRVDKDLLGGYYVIRDEDFNWIGATVKALIAVAIGKYEDAIPGLVGLLWDYRQKGQEVSTREGQLLLGLRGSKPMTVDELRTVLGDDWAPEEITSSLERLASLPTRSGKDGGFVSQLPDGLWRSNV